MNLVLRNTLWNLAANFLPLILGLILLPTLISLYGLERFGLLTLIWALIGYFSLFDLGLARALTQRIAELQSHRSAPEMISQLIRTALWAILILGILGGLTLWSVSPFLVDDFLHVSANLVSETKLAFALIAMSIPFVVLTSALRAILEAQHLFKAASIIRMILGIGTFVVPYGMALISPNLVLAAIGLIGMRAIICLLHVYAVDRSKIIVQTYPKINFHFLKPLMHFGGWMTISNTIGPIMVYLDRFIIAGILGAAATTFYVLPFEVLTKLLVIPAAIAGVLFPIFSNLRISNSALSSHRLSQGSNYVLILLFPIGVVITFLSPEWLSFWLNDDFATTSRATVIWLVIGILINGVAQILFAKLHAAKRSDWTAKLHLIEVIPYLIILWLCITVWGISGAAFAWCLRSLVDLIGMIYLIWKLNPENWLVLRKMLKLLTGASAVLLVSFINFSLWYRLLLVLVIFCLYAYFSLRQIRQDKIIYHLQKLMKKPALG
jgi:O-antigen/teichoic acid export membrane protein